MTACNACYISSTQPEWVALFVTRLRIDQPCPKHTKGAIMTAQPVDPEGPNATLREYLEHPGNWGATDSRPKWMLLLLDRHDTEREALAKFVTEVLALADSLHFEDVGDEYDIERYDTLQEVRRIAIDAGLAVGS